MFKKNYEESQIKIEELEYRFRDIDRERGAVMMQVEDLKMDKMRQKNEFMVLQAKATKMTNVLRRLASNISTYLGENKLLRNKLENVEKRQHLGLHDMTPRPDYREIFKRREFKHFKENFTLKIMQQEFSTSDIVEQMIDVVKAYESRLYFTGGTNNSPETFANLKQIKDLKPKKSNARIGRTSGNNFNAQVEARRSSRVGSRRNIPVDLSSKNTEHNTSKSSRLITQQGQQFPTGNIKARTQLVIRRSQAKLESSKSSSSLDSIASKLSDQDYQDIRTLEIGMKDINKDFKKLVDI